MRHADGHETGPGEDEEDDETKGYDNVLMGSEVSQGREARCLLGGEGEHAGRSRLTLAQRLLLLPWMLLWEGERRGIGSDCELAGTSEDATGNGIEEEIREEAID